MHTIRMPIVIEYLSIRRASLLVGGRRSEVIDWLLVMSPQAYAMFTCLQLGRQRFTRSSGWDDHTGRPHAASTITPRTVLVTGGNRGIGYAIAEEFVAQGHRVAVTARSGEGPSGSLTVRADVTDAASIDAAFTEIEAEARPGRGRRRQRRHHAGHAAACG